MKIIRNLMLCTLLFGSPLVAMKIGDMVPQDMIAKLKPCENPKVGDVVVFKVKDNYKFGKIKEIEDDVCSIFYEQRYTMRPINELFIFPEEKVAKVERSGKVPEDMIAKLQPCKNPQVGDIVAVHTRSRGWIFGKISSKGDEECEIMFGAFRAKAPMPYENRELFMVPEEEEEPRAEAKESLKKERAEGETEAEEESEAGE